METVKKRIPCIAPDSNGIPVLYVQGEPFLILGENFIILLPPVWNLWKRRSGHIFVSLR